MLRYTDLRYVLLSQAYVASAEFARKVSFVLKRPAMSMLFVYCIRLLRDALVYFSLPQTRLCDRKPSDFKVPGPEFKAPNPLVGFI